MDQDPVALQAHITKKQKVLAVPQKTATEPQGQSMSHGGPGGPRGTRKNQTRLTRRYVRRRQRQWKWWRSQGGDTPFCWRTIFATSFTLETHPTTCGKRYARSQRTPL
eukprot:3933279-Rhodomonas_salina.6